MAYLSELKLLCLFANSSTLLELVTSLSAEELANATLTKGKVKGSPKLSKIFLKAGVPPEYVSQYCRKTPYVSSQISSCLLDLKDQGNSVHYASCQATDSRAKWFTEAGGTKNFNMVKEDIPYLGKSLWLWTVGERMSKDGKGFRARAKLRLLTILGQPKAIVVDKIYGESSLLKSSLPDLLAWVDKKFGHIPVLSPETTDWTDSLVEFFWYPLLRCPSSRGGYQDSLSKKPSSLRRKWANIRLPADDWKESILWKGHKIAWLEPGKLEVFNCHILGFREAVPLKKKPK